MQILQRFSVTLFSVIMAIFVCNYLNVNTLKLQQISLITKSIDTYNSSNSRYHKDTTKRPPEQLAFGERFVLLIL